MFCKKGLSKVIEIQFENPPVLFGHLINLSSHHAPDETMEISKEIKSNLLVSFQYFFLLKRKRRFNETFCFVFD